MDWATRRKLTYVFILILIITLVGVGFYYVFLYKTPTCSDGKQNQKEDGIDCGGSCLKLCKSLTLRPVVAWQQAFEVSPDVYAALAYIQNPNAKAESSSVPYTFRIYDENNVLLAERQGRIYIPPGRNFAAFEGGIAISQGTPARTEFSFAEDYSWTVARKKPELIVSNEKAVNTSELPVVTASIENATLDDVGKVVVTAILYDAYGNAFAASRTVIDGIPHQSAERVTFTWPRPFERSVTKIEIIPIIQ